MVLDPFSGWARIRVRPCELPPQRLIYLREQVILCEQQRGRGRGRRVEKRILRPRDHDLKPKVETKMLDAQRTEPPRHPAL